MTDEAPVTYPGLLHFRCGHGVSASSLGVGPGVWMVVTDTDREQQGVTMQPADAITIAAALTDSVVRCMDPNVSSKLVGGAVEMTLRRVLAEVKIARKAVNDSTGLYQAESQLRWLLGER